jgi:hypothetical protein
MILEANTNLGKINMELSPNALVSFFYCSHDSFPPPIFLLEYTNKFVRSIGVVFLLLLLCFLLADGTIMQWFG